MKLKNALYAGVLMSVALFASCTSDDNDGVQLGGNGIQFSASIKGQTDVTTRAHDALWDENDQIGIFATNAGASAFTASNVQYKTSANGNLLAVGQPVSFKDATTKADFKAYYPYTAQAANGVVPVNVANQSNQAAIDLLYSNDATGKSAADAKVDLTFSHQLVKLALSIKAEDGVDVKGLALKVGGTSVSGSFDIAKGALTQDAAKQDVALKVAADNSAAEGIILPAASLNGVTLSVSNAAGTTKTVDLSALKTAEGAAITSFAAGSKYIFAVNLSKGTTPTDFTVKFGSASIKDWTTVPGGDINIDFGGEGGETPEPSQPVTIFDETLGGSTNLVSKNTDLSQFTGWVSGMTFEDVNGTLTVRSSGFTPKINNIWFPSAKKDGTRVDNDLKITGFSTAGFKTLTLSYDLCANVYGANDIVNASEITGSFNGQEFKTSDYQFTSENDKGKLKTFTVELPVSAISATSEIHLKYNTKTSIGMRMTNIKLVGTK